MYGTRAYDELKKEMKKLYEDYKGLYEDIHPLDHGYEPGSTHPVQEDINGGLAFGALISDFKVSRAKKKTFEQLRDAIKENDMILFYRAIKFSKRNLSQRNTTNRSLLDWAIHYNNPVAVNILLEEGVDPDKFHPSVGRPILNALSSEKTYYGKHYCAYLLMKNYIELYDTDKNDENAVMKIIKLKLTDLYDHLSLYKIESCPLTTNGENMLHYTARYGDNEMMRKVLECNLNIKDKTSQQETVLHILSGRRDKEEFIKQAIEKGIDVNEVDVKGNTALHYACENAQYKNIEILLEAGANPLAINFKQEKPLDKLNNTSSTDYKSIAKASSVLSAAINKVYEQMLEGKQPNYPTKIASQKPLFDLTGKSDQHQPE